MARLRTPVLERGPYRLLVIDDDLVDRKTVQRAALALGPNVVHQAANGREGVEIATREVLDVIFLDWTLGPETGADVARQLREAGVVTPIVLLTGTSDPKAVASAMQAGAVDYLPKADLDASLLDRTVRAALRLVEAKRVIDETRAANERHAQRLAALVEVSVRIFETADAESAVAAMALAAQRIFGGETSVEVDRGGVMQVARLGGAAGGEHVLRLDLPKSAAVRGFVETRRTSTFDESERLIGSQLVHISSIAIQKHLALAQAHARERERQEIVAVVSHDLRTPLQSFALGLDALRGQNEQLVSRLSRNVERMTRLINDLLEVARIQDAGLALRDEEHDPHRLLEDVAEQIAPLARTKGLTVSVAEPADLRVVVDGSRIAQALLNFASNAVRHTERGSISLAVARVDDALRFAVTDTGVGVPPEIQARLFDRLFQGPAGGANPGGLGLGLYIAHGIAQAHGGRVGVASELGRGSTFYLDVPLTRLTRG